MSPTPAKKAAPKKAAPSMAARITKLENDNKQLRADLDQTRWCFMEFLYHQVVAVKSMQAQQLLADPAVRKQLGMTI